MIDPVDTDALRELSARPAFTDMQRIDRGLDSSRALAAAADEVDRLRLSDSNATQQRDQLADALRRSDNENDRLRALIENAPHEESGAGGCMSFVGGQCDCWKADAL